MTVDLLVIGAGAAGIAAARAALAAGRSVRVLEARDRVGGRALTDHSLGVPFDLGATWLHAAEQNPLVPLAPTVGVALVDSDALRNEITFAGMRPVTPAEDAAYGVAWNAFEAAIEARAARGPDIPAADAAPSGGPWDATIAAWQGEVIAAAPLAAISLHDFAATLLEGGNRLPEGGMGALLERLGAGLPVTLSAPVATLRWGGAEAVAEGPFGTLRARAVICTLPTPLLSAGAIRFDPALPAEVMQAAHDLPLGRAIKVGLHAAGEDRLGLPAHTSTDRQVRPGEAMVPITFWPRSQPIAHGWIGAGVAPDIEREGPAAAEALMREEIAKRLGHDAPRAFRPGALVSAWGTDPLARGVYSHARVGAAGARAVLAAPLAGGRLVFAGEACHPTLAGTVGGAWLSGEAGAGIALAA
ncbi:flavin monoamine oxidase family protein [Falsiroseomonas sp. HW251]|uniref:flavin monoamine oxidase family protein n=1 Tax=Falsiroseomonas sp. HW251 TaxID=3390998 RepID=UPI003D323D9C